MTSPLIPDRSCGSCTLCCKLLGIEALQKPPGQWCPHCAPGKGCGIYSSRPRDCMTFHCAWRQWPALGQHWFPADSRLMVILSPESRHLLIKVDPGRPEAWKRAPHYGEIKRMAQEMVPAGFQVAVQVDDHFTFILPDRDVEIGVLAADEEIIFDRHMTALGPHFHVHKAKLQRRPR